MKHVIIIAEAGVNHNGNFELAKKMVDAAKEAGVDYVKFQTFNPKKLVSKYAEKAEYQKETTGSDETQLQMLQKLTLTEDNFLSLRDYCRKVGIGFISTPFDLDSIAFLETFDMDFWKVPSGEVTNLPYLEAIARTKRKVVMSTGMCDMNEIQDAIEVLEKNGTTEIILLHCNTQYPTPYEHVNLSAMNSIRDALHKEVGYSDHTQGIEVPIAAVAMGATVIEKHFTLDKNMEGPDHKASSTPDEFKEYVKAIRDIEAAMGNGEKVPTKVEKEISKVVLKRIVAKKPIKEGQVITENDICVKRNDVGLPCNKWDIIVGTKARKDYVIDEGVEL